MSNFKNNQAVYFQNKINTVMKNIHNVSIENNLKYIAVYGTLIGAVRHNGFIPWDDDLDIGLLREDYTILLDALNKELPKTQVAQTNLNDKFYYQHFSKVRLIDNDIREDYMAHFDISHGVWVDVFPYDKALKNPKMEEERVKKIDSWYKIWGFITPVPNRATNENPVKKYVKKTVQKVLIKSQKKNGLIVRNLQKKFNEIEKVISGEYYENKGYEFSEDIVVSYSFKFNKSFPYEAGTLNTKDFIDVESVKFEDAEILIPTDYDAILKRTYGDYMKLPSKEQRVPHHQILNSKFEKVQF